MDPERLWRPRKSRRDLFFKALQRSLLRAFPRHHDHRRGINRVARCLAPDVPRRSRVGFKWNMGWMHDFLEYMSLDPIYRRYHHGNITFSLLYAFTEHFVLVLSHDEVVHGKRSLLSKMPGDEWQKFANLRLFYAWMYGHPGKKLLFMGGEFGEWHEWNHDTSLDWHLLHEPAHRGIQHWVRDLNQAYAQLPALHEGDCEPAGFEWIDCHDHNNQVLTFLRKGRSDQPAVLVVCHFL